MEKSDRWDAGEREVSGALLGITESLSSVGI